MAFTLGAFEISDLIARGGMGRVYQARHLLEGYDAAVKVVPRNKSTRDLLLAEVRTTAGLNHPAIVAIYDYGEVSAIEAKASAGQVGPGTLWFAMELATGGTLETAHRPHNWPELRRLLLEILDALAHAHARGCVHRDLKPGNVLITERDNFPAYLLADFGIAHVVDPDGRLPETSETINAPAAGTPRFMAPEQIQAEWRDQGPWTDLYSLGCMAWQLATGAPVFEGETAVHVAMAHLTTTPGEFRSRFTVPAAYERWLRTLIQRDFRGRFDRAAVCAAALAELPDVTIDDARVEPGTNPSLPTLDSMPTFRMPSVQLRAIRRSDALIASGARPDVSHAVPEDWRPTRPAHAVGTRTGLGLFGVREISVQGRAAERDALWRTVRRAEVGRGVAACLLEGSEGLGKSQLLRWLAVRVNELGVGTVLRASHARMPGPSNGLTFALARHLGCVGLDREATRARLERDAPDHAAALAEVLNPTSADDVGGNLRFDSPSERYRVIADFLAHLSTHRPLLLLLDDVQWGADSLGLVRFLLTEAPNAAIVVVMALNPSELADHPLAARRLDELRDKSQVERVELEPLSHAEHVALIRQQARLRQPLAEDLVSMSGGDTNYSICVLSDWVERGVMELTPDGYDFGAGQQVAFPWDLNEAWGARIDRFCARFAMPARVLGCLGIAAVLGTEVVAKEWRSACTRRGLEPDERLVPNLIDAGIGRQTELGFQFAQGAITATLLERMRRSGAMAQIHLACAEAIADVATDSFVAERRGLHLLRAGEIDEALQQLRLALDERMEKSAYDEAIVTADLWLASTPAARSEDALLIRARRADAYRFRGDAELAESEAHAILELADTSARARGEGLRILAGLEHAGGQLDQGIRRYTDAVEAYRAANDTGGVAKAVHGRGWLHLNRSEVESARTDFELGVELADLNGMRADSAWSSQGLAEAAALGGDLPLAERAARHAIDEFEQLGSRSGRGMALASLGNVLATAGRADEARAAYDSAIDLLASFHSQLVAFALSHRLAFELAEGDDRRARAFLQRADDAPLTPAFRAVANLTAIALTTNEQERAARLSVIEQSWSTVSSHPLVRTVTEIVGTRLDDPSVLRSLWD